MTLPAVSQCRSCGASIRWVVSTKGNRMPIDASPHPNGNLYLTKRALDGQWCASAIGQESLEAARSMGRAYISHHATCPQAQQWRRKEGRK